MQKNLIKAKKKIRPEKKLFLGTPLFRQLKLKMLGLDFKMFIFLLMFNPLKKSASSLHNELRIITPPPPRPRGRLAKGPGP